jgi:hypothetical protein
MPHSGSCHCGKISYDVEGEIDQVIECNCSHCSRKGYLLWFVPRANLRFKSGESDLATYTFNKRHIKHHFCPVCGVAPFGFGEHPPGTAMAAINVRCLQNVEPGQLKIVQVDGRSA